MREETGSIRVTSLSNRRASVQGHLGNALPHQKNLG